MKFAPGDSTGLVACIQRLMGSPGLRDELVEEGGRRVAAFDIRHVAAEYLDLYEDLLGSP